MASEAARASTRHRQRAFGIVLSAPALLLVLGFSVVPLIAAVGLSLTSFDLFSSPRFIGLRNYQQLLADPVFWTATGNTLIFAVGQVSVGIVVVIFVAVLFNQALRGGAIMRTIVYLPQAASYVVVALVWNLLLDPFAGPLSRLVQQFTGEILPVLTDSGRALPAIVVMSLWRNLGYFMIIVLAALQAVPNELLEAARVDGAGAVSRFRWVTLPEIIPAVIFVAITWFLGALQMFTQSYVMTQGGPVNATRTIVYIMYDQAFAALNFGKASAIAVLLFGAVVVVSVALRLVGRRVAV
ncbi:carbohydrate ABC transporter permease [Microlunatus sp. GCM10028923]|uniref:carbohydrate ABC transporter permease n=1 Tax=Microlunatus sp. GCM10028923 TaxID=3273400 RepID=UPI0036078950